MALIGNGSDGSDWQNSRYPPYKVILVGEGGVGKSSIFKRVQDGTFQEGSTVSPVGQDQFKTFQTTRELRENGSKVCLHLWDTAGCERFRALTKSYYNSSAAIVFVFSLDESASLVSLNYWLDNAHQLAPLGATYFFVCNKTDLADDEQLLCEREIREFFAVPSLQAYQLYRTSAKDNVGIQDFIDAVLTKLDSVNQRVASGNPVEQPIRIDEPRNQRKEPTFFEKCCGN